jgi:hypothetical protein
MDKDYLMLKRASASRPSGEWRYDDYDVIADGVVVGRIMKAAAAPVTDARLRGDARGCDAGDENSYGRDHAAHRTRARHPVLPATGISHAAVGITAHAMQSMTIKGFIVHNRESGTYTLTDSGRATLQGILLDAGLS